MTLISVVITIVVVGFVLWLINLIPMQETVRRVLNAVVVVILGLWLLQVFGLLSVLARLRLP